MPQSPETSTAESQKQMPGEHSELKEGEAHELLGLSTTDLTTTSPIQIGSMRFDL